MPKGYSPNLGTKCPSHLLVDAARTIRSAHPFFTLLSLFVRREKTRNLSSLSRAHTLRKVGSRSRAYWVFLLLLLPLLPPLPPHLLLLLFLCERVSTRVNEMPRRRPLVVVPGRSINLQVQARRHFVAGIVARLVYSENGVSRGTQTVWLLLFDYSIY